jgi:ABC-type multidrug transport system fused ATPase/permease subunit
VQKQVNVEQFRIITLDAASGPILESLTLLLAGAIILVAAYMVLRTQPQSLSPTAFLTVMACLAGMADSLRKVSKLNNSLQRSNAAATRIFEMMQLPIERRRTVASTGRTNVDSTDGVVRLKPFDREIRFENLTFTYPGANTPALDEVNLAVPKGQSVAIVGRNGSGKTTLLALLPRFYEPQEGRILLDGVDIRQGNLRSLRSQIGIVTQDSVIFPGTILQNIAYGVPESQIERERAIDAARRAFAHDFILEKLEGYDTVLGEHGAQLSGGQKQRICIARAIYRDAPILILDEATSQIDAESEHLIQQAIESLMHDRTVFVIAHRFSTILSADMIVVIDRGRVIGQGTHDQLIQTCPIYLQLYERQLMGIPGGVGPAGEIASARLD